MMKPDTLSKARTIEDVRSAVGSSERIVGSKFLLTLGLRWHYSLGSWQPDRPLDWPSDVHYLAKAELFSSLDKSHPIRVVSIVKDDLGPIPPVNDERDILTALPLPSLFPGEYVLRIAFRSVVFGLPVLIGQPMVLYLVGSARLMADSTERYSANYISGDKTNGSWVFIEENVEFDVARGF